MPDSTTEAIDRIFDFLDKGADAADRVFNRGQRLADDQKARQAKRERREVIDAKATPKKGPAKASTSTAVVHKPHFYIVEATDPKGNTIFVVTDGGNARTECSTRDFANQILRALEKAP